MIFSLGGDMMEPIMKIIQMVVPMFMSPGKKFKLMKRSQLLEIMFFQRVHQHPRK